MKSISLTVLLALVVTAHPFAQQLTGKQRAAQLKRANRKITIGLVLLGTGALAAPLTALARREGDPGGPVLNASIGIMALGSGLVWWGATERRGVVRPETTIHVGVRSVRVTRTW